MALWSLLRARLRGLLRRDGVADEIRDELEFHVQMRAEEYERGGATSDQARRLAARRVGNLAVLRDRGYDERGGGMLETLRQDVKYGLRLLWRQRGFSALAIGTLALGIGLSTALASVLDAALIHPLPYSHPEELVRLAIPTAGRNGRVANRVPSFDTILALRAGTHAFAAIAMSRESAAPVTGGDEPERLSATDISDDYLRIYDATPVIGRDFTADDMREGAAPVVILGYDYWQHRMGGSPGVVGHTIRFDSGVATIVGVLPKVFGRTAAIYRPLLLTQSVRAFGGGSCEARLRPGVTLAEATKEMTAVLRQQPGGSATQTGRVESQTAALVQQSRTTAGVLTWSVGLILLVACVNITGLLLARGATRHAEMAIRTSIGAGRLRLVRQLLTESALLAAAGGAAGIMLAWWSLDAIVANLPIEFTADAPATLNWRVLAFAVVLTAGTGIAVGLLPAISLSRLEVTARLSRGAKSVGSALSRRGGQWLIAIETTLALVLLMGAGLMLRSMNRILSVDLGFAPDAIITVEATPLAADASTFVSYYTNLVGALRTTPGIAAVGAIDDLPLKLSNSFGSVETAAGKTSTGIRSVLPGYFEAMGIRARAGRLPTDADYAAGRTVAVLNQSAANQLFAGLALGQPITIGDVRCEVIGVVDDVRFNGPWYPVGWGPIPSAQPPAEVFRLYRPSGASAKTLTVVARPAEAGAFPLDRLRYAAQHAGARAIVDRVRTGSQWLDETIVTPRRQTVLLTLLGSVGFVLALVGVFGMTAYAVARRTQEIGVRVAFGARPRDVVKTMLGDAARPVGIGLLAGTAIAAVTTRLIATFLFETSPTDPLTFAAVAIALGSAACVAAWIPSRRAARVDPVAALRAD